MIFEIEGKPIPWKRARLCGKRFYDEQADQKTHIQLCIKNELERIPAYMHGLKLIIEYHMPIPKSWSIRKQRNMLRKPHVSKPDLSNLIKFTEDALNKIVWSDDKIICEIQAKKFYSEKECTIFRVEECESLN